MSEVTRLLDAASEGNLKAAELLLPLVYDELRRLAAVRMAGERPGHTLEATALVHEGYVKLVGKREFGCRRQFFAAAAEAMRRILVDAARRRAAEKRGGGLEQEEFEPSRIASPAPDDELLALNEALDQFEQEYPEKSELVKLRYFAGFTADDAAAEIGISPSTADRHWKFARAWLKRFMEG